MIIVLVIWASFDFRPCKKKFELHLCKKNLFEKGPWPHFMSDLACFGHVAVADCATFATWQST